MMRKLWILTGALMLGACTEAPIAPDANSTPVRSTSASGGTIDPALADLLAASSGLEPLEVVVTYDPAVTTSDAIGAEIQLLGAGALAFEHFPVVAALATPEQIGAIAGLSGVRGVFADEALEYHLAEGGRSIGADQVHAMGITGKGIGIAIMDSGIDGLYNPDVAYPTKTVQNVKMLVRSKDYFEFAGRDTVTGLKTPKQLKKGYELFEENLANTDNSSGHGTHVAGIAAGLGKMSGGKYTGMAPGAHLVGIGVGDGLVIINALLGFDWLLENHRKYNVKVVNNSWGSQGEFNPDHPINVATRASHDRGITVVFSAGNCGMGNGKGGGLTCRSSTIQNQLNRYSVAPWAISVAAGCKLVSPDPTNSQARCSDPLGLGRPRVLASFSSRGIPNDPLYHPDITGPGVYIVSDRASTGFALNALDLRDDPTTCVISSDHLAYYTCASGTSMSAPHLAGVVALLQEAAGGKLRPADVLNALTSTARKLPEFGEWEVGAGYVDAYAAVQSVKR